MTGAVLGMPVYAGVVGQAAGTPVGCPGILAGPSWHYPTMPTSQR